MPVAAHPEEQEDFYQVDAALWAEIMTYRGEWVVASRTEIISHGPDPEEGLREADERGIDAPLVVQVPEDPGVSFLL